MTNSINAQMRNTTNCVLSGAWTIRPKTIRPKTIRPRTLRPKTIRPKRTLRPKRTIRPKRTPRPIIIHTTVFQIFGRNVNFGRNVPGRNVLGRIVLWR